jgi:hypothetical protein
MSFRWISRVRPFVFGAGVMIAMGAGFAHGADGDAELQTVIEKQEKQIEALKKQLQAVAAPVAVTAGSADHGTKAALGEDAIKSIAGDYLKEKEKPAASKRSIWKRVTLTSKAS